MAMVTQSRDDRGGEFEEQEEDDDFIHDSRVTFFDRW